MADNGCGVCLVENGVNTATRCSAARLCPECQKWQGSVVEVPSGARCRAETRNGHSRGECGRTDDLTHYRGSFYCPTHNPQQAGVLARNARGYY